MKEYSLSIVSAEAIRVFAAGSTQETTATLAILDFTNTKVMERAEKDGTDYAVTLQNVALETLEHAKTATSEQLGMDSSMFIARIKRVFTLISFMTQQGIPDELVLIDHITARASEQLILTQLAIKNEAAANETPVAETETAEVVH